MGIKIVQQIYDILDCSPLRSDVFAKFRYVCEGREICLCSILKFIG